MNQRSLIALAIIIFLSFLGGLAIYLITPFGIGTSPDSVVYIGVANNFAAGRGLTTNTAPGRYEPLTQYPPFYPFVLAVGGSFFGEPYQAAQALAGLVFGFNIFLVGAVLLRLIQWSVWPAVFGAAIMLLAPPMLGIHVMAWSEPIFILLCLLSFIVLSGSIQRQKFGWLIVSAVLASLALFTRYAGVALVTAGLIGIFSFSRGRWPRRLVEALTFGSISVMPLLALLTYNQQAAGSATNRIFAFHPVTRAQLWQGLTTLSSWVGLPVSLPTYVHLIVVGFIFVVSLVFALDLLRFGLSTSGAYQLGNSPPHFIVLLALFTGIYSAFVVLSISFLDANTPLDDRILSPIYVTFLILVIYLVSRYIHSRKPAVWRLIPGSMVLILLVVYGASSFPFLRTSRASGIGFSSPVWENSALLQEIRGLPVDVAIHSNVPEAIYLHTGRPATRLPRVYERSAAQSNPEFELELLAIEAKMATEKAVIAFFNQPGRIENPSLEDIEAILDLEIQTQAADGWIYTLTNPAGE